MQDEQAVDRRRLLRRAGTVAAGVAGAGVVAATAATPAQAAPGENVVLGQAHDAAGTATSIANSSTANPTLVLGNGATDEFGGGGPALRLAPSGTHLTEQAPTGSLSADTSGTIWSSFELDGENFPVHLFSAATANITVPMLTPARVVDTRSAAGRARILNRTAAGVLDSAGRVRGGQTIFIDLSDFVASGEGVFGNLAAISPTLGGFLTLFPYDPAAPTARPDTANLGYATGQNIGNFSVTGIGFDPANPAFFEVVSLFASSTTHVIFDAFAFIVSRYDQVVGFSAPVSAARSEASAQRQAHALRRKLANRQP